MAQYFKIVLVHAPMQAYKMHNIKPCQIDILYHAKATHVYQNSFDILIILITGSISIFFSSHSSLHHSYKYTAAKDGTCIII